MIRSSAGSAVRALEARLAESFANPTDLASEGRGEELAWLSGRVDSLERLVRGLIADPMTAAFELLADPRPESRRRGVEILRDIALANEDALAGIRERLEDPAAEVRRAAANALEVVEDVDSVTRILPILELAGSDLKAEAIER